MSSGIPVWVVVKQNMTCTCLRKSFLRVKSSCDCGDWCHFIIGSSVRRSALYRYGNIFSKEACITGCARLDSCNSNDSFVTDWLQLAQRIHAFLSLGKFYNECLLKKLIIFQRNASYFLPKAMNNFYAQFWSLFCMFKSLNMNNI